MHSKDQARKPGRPEAHLSQESPNQAGGKRLEEDGDDVVARGIESKEPPLQPERAHGEWQIIRRRGGEPQPAESIGSLHIGVVGQQVVVVPEPFAIVNRRVNPKAGHENDNHFQERHHPLSRCCSPGHQQALPKTEGHVMEKPDVP